MSLKIKLSELGQRFKSASVDVSKQEISKYFKLFVRLLPLLVLASPLFFDVTFGAILYVVSMVTLSAAVGHAIRVLLFPYLDLSQALRQASSQPLSASILVFSVCLIIVVSMLCFAMLLG